MSGALSRPESRGFALAAAVGACAWSLARGGLYVFARLVDELRQRDIVIPAERAQVYELFDGVFSAWVWGLLLVSAAALALWETRDGRWRSPSRALELALAALAVLHVATALLMGAADPLSPAWAAGAVAGAAAAYARYGLCASSPRDSSPPAPAAR